MRLLALSSLINVCDQNKSTRPVVLGGDVKLDSGYSRGEDMMEIIKVSYQQSIKPLTHNLLIHDPIDTSH